MVCNWDLYIDKGSTVAYTMYVEQLYVNTIHVIIFEDFVYAIGWDKIHVKKNMENGSAKHLTQAT